MQPHMCKAPPAPSTAEKPLRTNRLRRERTGGRRGQPGAPGEGPRPERRSGLRAGKRQHVASRAAVASSPRHTWQEARVAAGPLPRSLHGRQQWTLAHPPQRPSQGGWLCAAEGVCGPGAAALPGSLPGPALCPGKARSRAAEPQHLGTQAGASAVERPRETQGRGAPRRPRPREPVRCHLHPRRAGRARLVRTHNHSELSDWRCPVEPLPLQRGFVSVSLCGRRDSAEPGRLAHEAGAGLWCGWVLAVAAAARGPGEPCFLLNPWETGLLRTRLLGNKSRRF